MEAVLLSALVAVSVSAYVSVYAGTYPCDDSQVLLHLLTLNAL